jgi:small subunit ribosomal protein S17
MEQEIKAPKEACDDQNCPFHGSLKIRGKTFTGVIRSAKMQKTATVEWMWQHYVPKYERYEKLRTRVKAHNPPCLKAKQGDKVMLQECRPLSKTKRYVIIKKLGE